MKHNKKMTLFTSFYCIKRLSLFVITLILILSGCSVDNPTEVEDYEQEPMLSAFLYNGEPIDVVHLEWTAPFLGYYDPDDYPITNAVIMIEDLTDTTIAPLQLVHDDPSPGHYYSDNPDWLPRGTHNYRITADFSEGEEAYHLEAIAMVPDTFTVMLHHPNFPEPGTLILPNPPDSLIIADTLTREDSVIVVTWSESDSNGGYFCNILTLTDTADLVPLDPDFVIGEDELEEDEFYRFNLQFMPDDQEQFTMGWYNFVWEGPHHIDIMAISVDYYDYVYAGIMIMMGLNVDVPSNIDGGQGIFGGMCRRSFHLNMKRVE